VSGIINLKKDINRDPTLCRSFVRQTKEALSHFPQVKHEWSIDADEDHCILDIPEESDNDFPITVEVYPEEIIVMTIGPHTHFQLEGSPDILAARALGFIRDLLSPAMRIRERLAGDKPYKWSFEVYQEGQWVTEEQVGLLFWNYFGKRTEKIYQNRILPARENPIEEHQS
jgi:hypothetical protein